jgi:hypothetical protein
MPIGQKPNFTTVQYEDLRLHVRIWIRIRRLFQLICDLGKTPSSTNNGLFGLFPCACLAARIRFLGGTRPIRRFYFPLDGPA